MLQNKLKELFKTGLSNGIQDNGNAEVSSDTEEVSSRLIINDICMCGLYFKHWPSN